MSAPQLQGPPPKTEYRRPEYRQPSMGRVDYFGKWGLHGIETSIIVSSCCVFLRLHSHWSDAVARMRNRKRGEVNGCHARDYTAVGSLGPPRCSLRCAATDLTPGCFWQHGGTLKHASTRVANAKARRESMDGGNGGSRGSHRVQRKAGASPDPKASVPSPLDRNSFAWPADHGAVLWLWTTKGQEADFPATRARAGRRRLLPGSDEHLQMFLKRRYRRHCYY